MKYVCLATDYDGTVALEGRVARNTLDRLQRARASGLRLVLVTGRELSDLFNAFPHSAVFDRIVAENGAVLCDPSTQSVRPLAPAPPPALLELLEQQAVPLSAGHSVVATVKPYDAPVLQAIRTLGLEWAVSYNKEAVMSLPRDVTKATGLKAALDELGVAAHETVGVGDAENDQPFLEICGIWAAVANALPAIKERADVVTAGADGAGITELIDRLLNGELDRLRHAEGVAK